MSVRRLSSVSVGHGGVVAGVVVAWVAGEVALRWLLAGSLAECLGSLRGADMVAVTLGFPVLAGVAVLLGRRLGLSVRAFELGVSLRGAAAAVGGVIAWFGVLAVAAVVLAAGEGSGAAPTGSNMAVWVAAVFVVGNVIVVPITEELAWRGVIQTGLDRRFGTVVAVVLTVLAFTGKHLIVDATVIPLRVVSLLALATALSLLRVRYGTGSAIVAHVLANGVGTVPAALAGL